MFVNVDIIYSARGTDKEVRRKVEITSDDFTKNPGKQAFAKAIEQEFFVKVVVRNVEYLGGGFYLYIADLGSGNVSIYGRLN